MRKLISSPELRRFLRAQEGATVIEYAMIASGISIAILTAATTLGSNMMTIFYNKLANIF